jgi:gliding motility-associated-like protein
MLVLNATTPLATAYLWNDSSTAATNTVNDTGTYSAHVYVSGEVCYRIYNYDITFSYPDTSTGGASFCSGTSVTLTAQSTGVSYLWNTGDTTMQITVSDSGQYTVTINDTARLCPHIEHYIVTVEAPDSSLLPEAKCNGAELKISVQDTTAGNSYLWNTGATTDTILVTSPGSYSVVISNPSWTCPKIENFEVTDNPEICLSEYNLPNVFTPDGSGANDLFQACSEAWTSVDQQVKCPPYKNIRDVNMQIFNRWGERVYHTSDRDINWNGKLNGTGAECPDGVYYYTCIAYYIYPVKGEQTKEIHGFVTLMRKK